jgi:predicted AAA+ superfamily ATPase
MSIIKSLQEYSVLFFSKRIPKYERDLLYKLNLDNRLIGIIGAKGVGKTTLLLQFMKKQSYSMDEMLYISVDHPLMSSTTILEVAKDFAALGGQLLILDEIHTQANFANDLKTIWDFLEINVIFSGSSALHLEGADLSRRALKYRLPTLSFREFLEMETAQSFERYSLEEIVSNHTSIATNILSSIKPLKYFKEYMLYGYYPFYLEDRKNSKMKLTDAINKTIDVDLVNIYTIDAKKLRNIKKILTMLCLSAPYKPNMRSLSASVELDSKTLYGYLNALQAGCIIRMVAMHGRGESIIKKPEKIYLDNPNMFHSLCSGANVGTLRESFIASSLENAQHAITASKKGDFIIDSHYTIEVGGKNKGFEQIKDIENSFVVADDIEIGFGNRIPLWLFGFLY